MSNKEMAVNIINQIPEQNMPYVIEILNGLKNIPAIEEVEPDEWDLKMIERTKKGKNMRIVLASASPRRKELLQKLFAEFEIIPAKGAEYCTRELPEEIVLELSSQKAYEIEQALYHENTDCEYLNDEQNDSRHPNDSCTDREYLIIGADTIVAWQGRVLGKPKDPEDAKNMLRMLSGNKHQVYTGVTAVLYKNGKRRCIKFTECTLVTFYPMSEAEIEAYTATGEPMDKAGSYGIQGIGGRFVEKIEEIGRAHV